MQRTKKKACTRLKEREQATREKKKTNRRTPFSWHLDFPSLRGKKRRSFLVRQMVLIERTRRNASNQGNFSKLIRTRFHRRVSLHIAFQCQKMSADFKWRFVWFFRSTKTISKERGGSKRNKTVASSLVHL